MDYRAGQFWFNVVQWIGTIGLGAWVYISNKVKAQKQDIDDVNEAVVKIDNRVAKLETAALSQEDLGKVHDKINQVSDRVSMMCGKMDGIKGAVDMIQDHLLNNGGKQ